MSKVVFGIVFLLRFGVIFQELSFLVGILVLEMKSSWVELEIGKVLFVFWENWIILDCG